MIIKCSVGQGMNEGVAYYSTDKKSKKETELRKLIGKSPYLFSDNPREIEKECLEILDENDKLVKYVFRAMFSVQANEKLSESNWRALVQDYCKEYGFDLNNHQYLLYEHNDTNNQHVHLIVNRKPVLGNKTINDSFFKIKSQTIIPKLIDKYCLKQNPKVVQTNSNVSFDAKREEKLMFVKQTCNYYLSQLKSWNHSLLNNQSVSIDSFSKILEKHTIELVVKKSNENKIVGVTFVYAGERFSGQQAGLKADRLLKKIQQMKDKNFKLNKLLNDSFKNALSEFNNSKIDKRSALLKEKLGDAGFFFERYSNKLTNDVNQQKDKLNNESNDKPKDEVKSNEVLNKFKFQFQDFDFNDLDKDLVKQLLDCEGLANDVDLRLKVDDNIEKMSMKDNDTLQEFGSNSLKNDNLNNLFDFGSDASNSGRFKAMDDEEEKEKQRKSKRNRGV